MDGQMKGAIMQEFITGANKWGPIFTQKLFSLLSEFFEVHRQSFKSYVTPKCFLIGCNVTRLVGILNNPCADLIYIWMLVFVFDVLAACVTVHNCRLGVWCFSEVIALMLDVRKNIYIKTRIFIRVSGYDGSHFHVKILRFPKLLSNGRLLAAII